MNIGNRVNWRINCLNEDHFGTIGGKSLVHPDLYFVIFDNPVVGADHRMVMTRDVYGKDLGVIK